MQQKGRPLCTKELLSVNSLEAAWLAYQCEFLCLEKKRTAGCYLNFLETASHILLPVFSHPMDRETVWEAENLFSKTIVPVDIHETAEEGGTLNCISWESM